MTPGAVARPGTVAAQLREYRVRSSFVEQRFELRYLLSTDTVGDSKDIFLASEIMGSAEDFLLGTHAGSTAELTIPACVPGSNAHFIVMVVDPDDAIDEFDESNNSVATEVSLIPPPTRTDLDGNCAADVADMALLVACLGGPGVTTGSPPTCTPQLLNRADMDNDGDVDLEDAAAFCSEFRVTP
jgi:hypothetical protein